MPFDVVSIKRLRHLMQFVQFLKDKFNPSRPMGRKNFILSFLAYMVVVAPVIFFIPGIGQEPLPPYTTLLLMIWAAPCWMLYFRRANAALIPVYLIAIAWLLTPIKSFIAHREISVFLNIFQIILGLFLLFKKNKVEPVTPWNWFLIPHSSFFLFFYPLMVLRFCSVDTQGLALLVPDLCRASFIWVILETRLSSLVN